MLHKGDEKPVIRHDNSGPNGDNFTYEIDVSARANNPVQSGMPIFGPSYVGSLFAFWRRYPLTGIKSCFSTNARRLGEF